MLDRLCILASLLHFLDRRRSCRVSTGSRVLAGEFFAGTHVGYTPPIGAWPGAVTAARCCTGRKNSNL